MALSAYCLLATQNRDYREHQSGVWLNFVHYPLRLCHSCNTIGVPQPPFQVWPIFNISLHFDTSPNTKYIYSLYQNSIRRTVCTRCKTCTRKTNWIIFKHYIFSFHFERWLKDTLPNPWAGTPITAPILSSPRLYSNFLSV